METLVDEGITSYKLFMAYPGVFYSDDAQILRAMQKARRPRAADDDARRERPGHRRARRAAGRVRQDDSLLPRHRPCLADGGGGHPPRDHARRPHRGPALRRARQRQAGGRAAGRGPRPRARTCSARPARSTSTSPSRSSSARGREEWGDFEGAKWVCSTPLRSREEGHQDAMWQALRTNDLQMVSTDHCPFCMKEQKELGNGRLPGHPQRHRVDRAPHRPALPGRRDRRRSRSSGGSS